MIAALLAGTAFVLLHYAAAALFALVAFLLGRALVRNVVFADVLETVAVAVTLGSGGLGLAMLALGLAGGFNVASLVAMLVLVVAAAGFTLARAETSLFSGRTEARGDRPRLPASATRLLAVLAALLLLPTLVVALYPPVGFDATLYHLPFAKAFEAAGGLVLVRSVRFPILPQLHDLLFTLMRMLVDDVAAKLVQTVALFASAALLASWGRRYFSARAGLWAAALWLGDPLAAGMGTTAYVDAGFTMFAVLAVYGCTNWWNDRVATAEVGVREGGARQSALAWLVIGGLAAGFAAATKHHGLVLSAILAGLVSMAALRFRCPRAAVAFLLAVLVTAGPSYARIYAETGLPLFPYRLSVVQAPAEVGSSRVAAVEASDRRDIHARTEHHLPGSKRSPQGLLAQSPMLLTLLWDLFAAPQTFIGTHLSVSPAYALALPVVLLLLLPACRVPLAVAGVYTLFWFVTLRDPRYLMPALALLAVCTSGSMDELLRRFARNRPAWTPVLAAVGLVVLLAPAAVYHTALIAFYGPLPLSEEGREAFLLRRPDSCYEGLRFLNRTYGADYAVYAVDCEQMNYWAEGRFVGDVSGPGSFKEVAAWFQIEDVGTTPEAVAAGDGARGLLAFLRRQDVDLLLVPGCEERLRFDAAGYEAEGFQLLTRGDEAYPGESCVYRLPPPTDRAP